LTDEKGIRNRWNEHFREQSTQPFEFYEFYENESYDCIDEKIEEPTLYEIQEIIRNIKRMKTSGTDNINAELLHVAGPQMTQRIQELILNVWRTERMPNEWNKSIICPIYKKGEKSECSNYRGISLLNTAYTRKISATVINNILKTYAEDLLSQEQNGFRRNRSTTDNLFIMRQILEKCYKYDIEMHVLFIDFKQAFDSVDRQKIIQILQELRVPNKLVRLIKMTILTTEASVKIENLTSKPLVILYDVRQGDPLSATMFNLILDSVIKKSNLRGDVSLKLTLIVAYADDVAPLARSLKALKEIFRKLQNEATLVGLNINEHKTKYVQIKRKGMKDITHLKIDNFTFENVENFNYLGFHFECR